MTKQEAIQKAYGEHWEILKNNVDYNGWATYANNEVFEFGIEPFGDYEINSVINGAIIWRPKSLEGIENNNGWIKIENEADLPKEKIKVWFIHHGEIKIGTYHFGINEFRSGNEILIQNKDVTHYQPIIKPKPPIY